MAQKRALAAPVCFPTHVGMNRAAPALRRVVSPFSHMHRDEPMLDQALMAIVGRFPTYVRMNRLG